ncbi:chemotaxis response regulator protein-glutamate methylesterase [Paludicola sp. MB14-C6]|uniref:protein-glutamate methylesterase/protein-glutamine glutaminase n=1 Tax=Paludihabitans sp. MB14-C6 TaxID=3070656 RepID=UPI0027DB1494|nr:chemotaxis response regulator protein-glutamate methylesterase [Paludicola sp. MB14-C6]WMJ21900.1 chemotaxis response regulator protein-glutamate methylesterase [Paludicola sp. MB14-C6]
MKYRKIKVFIVDDSLFFRTTLEKLLSEDGYFEVIGSASSAIEAEKKIIELNPDVVTLDEEMPGMRGSEFIKKFFPQHPIPMVLVSSLDMNVFEALQCGAIDFVKKPVISKSNDLASFANELAIKIKIAAAAHISKSTKVNVSTQAPLKLQSKSETIIAIGASTGGTEATLEIVKQFPADFPPVLITQHMPAGFTQMYAERLNRLCNITVKEAVNGMRVEKGTAIVAAGDFHMTLEKDAKGYYVKSVHGEKVSGHCPSVDVLFQSVAKTAGANTIGVILTGMGRDGANGLLEMHNKGAFTIGQEKDSCVVYGMPMEAFKLGAVDREAACENIASIIINQLNKKG